MTSDDAFMALAGVRYCLGRHSYAPSLCCDWLRRRWIGLPTSDRAVILRDIREHVRLVENEGQTATGWEIDLATWRTFLNWAADQPPSRVLDVLFATAAPRRPDQP